APLAQTAWVDEFNTFSPSATNQEVPFGPNEMAEFEKAFQVAQQQASWEQEFAEHEGDWAEEFNSSQALQEVDITGDPKEALAKTAGLLLNAVETSDNPKFKASKFMDFMKQLRDQKLVVEGNKVVEPVAAVNSVGLAETWAKEFGQSINPTSWEEEFSTQQQLPSWEQEFQQSNGNFQGMSTDGDDADLERAFWESGTNSVTLNGVQTPGVFKEEPVDHQWEAEFQKMQELGPYTFAADNPYLETPKDVLDASSHADVATAILALEAAVQRDPQNARAWSQLGLKQQENQDDAASIDALSRAVQLDAGQLDAWMGLAVANANELRFESAYRALAAWIANNPAYSDLANGAAAADAHPTHDALVGMYVAAARRRAGTDLDADVQQALGVLFNMSEEYDKAVDCFEAALSKSPQDYMLWNKLGATLANANRAARAADAYRSALALNPSLVRARYNMAVALVQLGSHREAAEYLLGALYLQRASGIASGGGRMGEADARSDGLWGALRSILDSYLLRRDLLAAVDARDVDAFRGEFKFL
ncbi:Peroxisomal membrane signal receptor PTS1, partial [Cladochytrium tenue]